MPLRRRDHGPSKNVTLYETLNWIAFDDFNGPEPHVEEIKAGITGDIGNLEAIEFAQYRREEHLSEAEPDLFAALQDGDISAQGRFSDVPVHPMARSTKERTSDWTQRPYEDHSEKRTEIPADFWRREGIDWNGNRARSPNGEYADIILKKEDVLALWPFEEGGKAKKSKYPDPFLTDWFPDVVSDDNDSTSSVQDSAKTSDKRRGRKPQYPENEFYAYCALEVAANDLPESQAELVGRMETLLAIVWGGGDVPGKTWLKDRVSRIYKLKDKYELGRQEMEK